MKYEAKIIWIGNIINLYLGKIKNRENIKRFKNKYKPRHLFWNLSILKNKNKPGRDKTDSTMMGKIWKKL